MDPAPIAAVSLFTNPFAEVLSFINPDSAAAGAPRAAGSGGLGVGPSNGAPVVVPSKLGNGGIVLTPSQLKNDGSVSVDEIQDVHPCITLCSLRMVYRVRTLLMKGVLGY